MSGQAAMPGGEPRGRDTLRDFSRLSVIRRLENAAVALAVIAAFVHLGFAWWWLLVLFLVLDLSALGYLWGTRAGAIGYNLAHNYVPPALLGVVWVWDGSRWLAFVALVWAFHVAVDRALGYGLKHSDHFQHTDLGWIGRPASLR